MNKELRTLYNCRNHWQWMLITQSFTKESYKPSLEWLSYCACCNSHHCYECPLNEFAWTNKLNPSRIRTIKSPFVSGCVDDDDSFYVKWLESSIEDRPFWAGRMVYACNKAIEAGITK